MGNEKCDFCQKKAYYDARMIFIGTWAYMCRRCFEKYGIKLGLGYGQVLKEDEEGDEEDEEM